MKISTANRDELQAQYRDQKNKIIQRLEDFKNVPEDQYFYELLFCLLTPQSSAVHCNAAANALKDAGFRECDIDPEPYLAPSETGYVRFHKTKARRLLALKDSYADTHSALATYSNDKELRSFLVKNVNGIGYKEASHFLRNIGRLDVTIIDRHIITNFIRLGILTDKPTSISPKRYLELEAAFEELAAITNIPVPALDLLLWSRETGFLLK
jgi:N-glycosylase/DNA lyase